MKSYIQVFKIGFFQLKKVISRNDRSLAITVLIIPLCLLIPYWLVQDKSLDDHTAYAVGVIYYRVESRTPGNYYKFWVGDNVYTGKAGLGGINNMKVGDSLFVCYDYTNPKNNSLYSYF
ncbi:MAG: hypothetical protein K2J10_04365, partial [Muribaculaceae bacterium]|nr:hypothetical protein [Muribaculaceae bacterium]